MAKQQKMDDMIEGAGIEAGVRHGHVTPVNETTPAAERIPELKSPITSGPELGKGQEFLPAAYEVTTLVGKERRPVKLIREDR